MHIKLFLCCYESGCFFDRSTGGCVSTHLAGKKVEILIKGILESGDEDQPRFTAKILLKSW